MTLKTLRLESFAIALDRRSSVCGGLAVKTANLFIKRIEAVIWNLFVRKSPTSEQFESEREREKLRLEKLDKL